MDRVVVYHHPHFPATVAVVLLLIGVLAVFSVAIFLVFWYGAFRVYGLDVVVVAMVIDFVVVVCGKRLVHATRIFTNKKKIVVENRKKKGGKGRVGRARENQKGEGRGKNKTRKGQETRDESYLD